MAENSLVPRTRPYDSESTSLSPDSQNPPQLNWPQNPFPQNPPPMNWPQNPFPQNPPQMNWSQNQQQQNSPTSNPTQIPGGAMGGDPLNTLHAQAQQSLDHLCRLTLAYGTYRVANEIPAATDAVIDGARYVANEATGLARYTYEAAQTYVPVALTTVSGAVSETVTYVAAAVGVSPPVLCVLAAGLTVVGIAGIILWTKNRNTQRN